MSSDKKRSDKSRIWQGVFLCLLLICVAQVSYWVVDQIDHAQKHRDLQLGEISAYETLSAANLDDPAALKSAVLKHLSSGERPAGQGIPGSTDPAQTIHDSFGSRKSRILWEGAFFIFVLFGAIGVIFRALNESRLLVERQQNFIATITHELRTPLASLKLSADTLRLRPSHKGNSERLGSRINEDVDRLNEMVTQILQSARLDAGAQGPPPVATELMPLLDAEVGRLQSLLASKGVNFLVDQTTPDAFVLARTLELKTVVTNLLSNAGKSCRAAGGGTVKVSAKLEGSMAMVTVSDDGIGFDPGEARKIFERFYRPGDEMRRETPGYGLGLYLVHEITRNHGGKVRAESPGPGSGATLTLWWPTCRPAG